MLNEKAHGWEAIRSTRAFHPPSILSFIALHNLSGTDRQGCRYLLHYWISPFTSPFGLEITGNMHSQHCSFSKQQSRPNIMWSDELRNCEMGRWGWVRVFFWNKWEGLFISWQGRNERLNHPAWDMPIQHLLQFQYLNSGVSWYLCTSPSLKSIHQICNKIEYLCQNLTILVVCCAEPQRECIVYRL